MYKGYETKGRTFFRNTSRVRRYIILGGLCIILGLIPFKDKFILRIKGLWIEWNRSAATAAPREHDGNNHTLIRIGEGIEEKSLLKEYHLIEKSKADMYKGRLILINKAYPYLFLEDNKLVSLSEHSYYELEEKMKMDKEAKEALSQMIKGLKQYNKEYYVTLTSAYRDLEVQKEILNEKIDMFGKTNALNWAMVPGYSEHHSGYAVDLSIHLKRAREKEEPSSQDILLKRGYAWMNDHAYEYGFIRRYKEDKTAITGVFNERWHFRYVSKPHSYIIDQKNYCYEEYIDYIRQFEYDKMHLLVEAEHKNYEIYFVKETGRKTQIPVPNNKKYSISGNNVDGFIVTVYL